MPEPQNTTRPMTEGEYRVGISFKPGGNPAVDAIKAKAAELIDMMVETQSVAKATETPEAARCAALAMTAFEDGAMWAVKAVTKPKRD